MRESKLEKNSIRFSLLWVLVGTAAWIEESEEGCSTVLWAARES